MNDINRISGNCFIWHKLPHNVTFLFLRGKYLDLKSRLINKDIEVESPKTGIVVRFNYMHMTDTQGGFKPEGYIEMIDQYLGKNTFKFHWWFPTTIGFTNLRIFIR